MLQEEKKGSGRKMVVCDEIDGKRYACTWLAAPECVPILASGIAGHHKNGEYVYYIGCFGMS